MAHTVVTYNTARGEKIAVTRRQARKMSDAGVWPKSALGEEFAQVYKGLTPGEPTYSDAQIEAFCQGGELLPPPTHPGARESDEDTL